MPGNSRCKMGYLLAKRKTSSLSKQESELLLKINKGLLTTGDQVQYDRLYKQL
ncbi:MAG: hypothetical protein KDD04_11770 [Sinomicrobium sp.]|nr:hypothetical protein [Sinomicrobium sp.]